MNSRNSPRRMNIRGDFYTRLGFPSYGKQVYVNSWLLATLRHHENLASSTISTYAALRKIVREFQQYRASVFLKQGLLSAKSSKDRNLDARQAYCGLHDHGYEEQQQ